MDSAIIDAENPKAELAQFEANRQSQDVSKNSGFQEAAALLTIFSLLIINQASIRYILTDPNGGLDQPGRPSAVLLLIGGLAELIFGLLGLYIGMAALIFKQFNTELTKLAMMVQLLLGTFTFVLFVLAQPILGTIDLAAPTHPDLSLGESRLLLVLGALTALHFFLALQGGQFTFFARLIASATGEDFFKHHTGNRMRAIFWNVNFLLAGIWTLIAGAIANSSIGAGKLDAPFNSAPNIGRLPGLTIFIGVAVIAWSALGVVMAFVNNVPWIYYVVGGVIYLSGFLNYTIIQFSLLDSNPAAVSLHGALVFAVVFMGPYFVYQNSKGKTESL